MLIENPDVSRTENLPYLINTKFHFSLNQYKSSYEFSNSHMNSPSELFICCLLKSLRLIFT